MLKPQFKNYNICFMGPVEIVQVFEKKVSCSGSTSEPNSSHPLVYLNIGDKPSITCPYCSKTFTTNKVEPKITSKYNILMSKTE